MVMAFLISCGACGVIGGAAILRTAWEYHLAARRARQEAQRLAMYLLLRDGCE